MAIQRATLRKAVKCGCKSGKRCGCDTQSTSKESSVIEDKKGSCCSGSAALLKSDSAPAAVHSLKTEVTDHSCCSSSQDLLSTDSLWDSVIESLPKPFPLPPYPPNVSDLFPHPISTHITSKNLALASHCAPSVTQTSVNNLGYFIPPTVTPVVPSLSSANSTITGTSQEWIDPLLFPNPPSIVPNIHPNWLDVELGDVLIPQHLYPNTLQNAPPVPTGDTLDMLLGTNGNNSICPFCGPGCQCGSDCQCSHVNMLSETLAAEEGGDLLWQSLISNAFSLEDLNNSGLDRWREGIWQDGVEGRNVDVDESVIRSL